MKKKKTTQESLDDFHKAWEDLKKEWNKSEGGRILLMIFVATLVIATISLIYDK